MNSERFNFDNIIISFCDVQTAKNQFMDIKDSFLNTFPESKRKSPASLMNFFMARMALLKAIEKQDNKKPSLSMGSIVNFHYLANNPQNICSLSHTDGCAVAILSNLSNHRSLGVDLELINRSMPENASKYFRNEHDSDEWNDMQLWVIKEACFKALHPLWKRLHLKQNMVIKELFIEHRHFYTHNQLGTEISGFFELKTIKFNGLEYYLCLAALEKENRVCY